MPGTRHGFSYEGREGSKLSYRSGSRKGLYGPPFGRNDVVGCGWNKIEGKVFFTKNGKYPTTLEAFEVLSLVKDTWEQRLGMFMEISCQ